MKSYKKLKQNKLKIVFICPDWFPNISGFALSCLGFAERLKKDGHKVTIVVPKIKGVESKGQNIIAVPYWFDLLGRMKIVKNIWPYIKSVVEESDIVCLYSYMFEMNTRVLKYRQKDLFNKPVVLMYRGSLEDEVLKFLSLPTKLAKLLWDTTLGRYIFKRSDHTISNSGPTYKVMKRKYNLPKSKFSYIPSAITVKDFKVSTCKEKRAIFVGRLVENKGVHLFEKIIKSLPLDWEFAIIGNGPMEDYVKKLNINYPNIKMYGYLNHKKTKEIMQKSSINILPTFAEGSPRVVLESAASGMPSVAFAVGDVSNTIPEGTGFSIDNFDIDKLCEKINYLINNDAVRIKMGKSARNFAEKNVDWNVVYKSMLTELKKIISKY